MGLHAASWKDFSICKFKKENAAIGVLGAVMRVGNMYSLVVLVFSCMIPSEQLLPNQ